MGLYTSKELHGIGVCRSGEEVGVYDVRILQLKSDRMGEGLPCNKGNSALGSAPTGPRL